jgi:hypothetical protein
MYASSGGYSIIMRADGNLVTYNASNQPVWSSNTFGNPGAYLVMQADGNLVIYNDSGQPIWSTNTLWGTGSYATIQGDGNFVVYHGSHARWASFSPIQP